MICLFDVNIERKYSYLKYIRNMKFPSSKELFDSNLFHKKLLTSSLNLTSVQIFRMLKGNEFQMCIVL